MKSNRMNTIKSRRLKSKKYKRKTRVRVHLGKNKQRGGARCEIDFSNRDILYVDYITYRSNKKYSYKLNLIDKTFETYDPKKDNYVDPRPLNEITPKLRSSILRVMDDEIKEIFAEHDIDPLLPLKIPSSPSSSRKSSSSHRESPPQALSPSTSSFSPSSRPDSDGPSFSEASPHKSSSPPRESPPRESSSKALGRVTPLKMEKLNAAMNFAKTYKSKSNQLPPLRSRPSVSDIIYESPYSQPLQRPLQRPLLIPLRQSSQSRQTRKNR